MRNKMDFGTATPVGRLVPRVMVDFRLGGQTLPPPIHRLEPLCPPAPDTHLPIWCQSANLPFWCRTANLPIWRRTANLLFWYRTANLPFLIFLRCEICLAWGAPNILNFSSQGKFRTPNNKKIKPSQVDTGADLETLFEDTTQRGAFVCFCWPKLIGGRS